MANNRTLTTANAVVALSVSELFPVPQIIDEFEANNPFSLDDMVIAETVMALDGTLQGGYVPSMVTWTLSLLPTSSSKQFFVDWMQASKTAQTLYRCKGNVTIPGEKANYTLVNGILVSGGVMPSVRKMQQSVTYKIQFSSKDIISVSL